MLSAIVLVHLLLLVWWLHERRPAVRVAAEPPALQVRLLPRSEPAPTRPTAAPTRLTAERHKPPAVAPAITWMAPDAAAVPSAAATITPGPAAPAALAASAAPLNLAWPRAASAPWRAVDAVRRDLQPAARPGKVESALGRLSENDGERVHEESLGDGRTRLRGRGGCVEIHEARMGRLDPFNQSVQPLPRMATPCRGDPRPRTPD